MGRFQIPVIYDSLTEYIREVTASAVAFRPLNESFHFPSIAPLPSISPRFPLHQISYSHPKDWQRIGDSSGIASLVYRSQLSYEKRADDCRLNTTRARVARGDVVVQRLFLKWLLRDKFVTGRPAAAACAAVRAGSNSI
ncbi:hypothetical protein EVAR_58165_1 [Eumeta japonica]|uniref:Uncharacterized protein n=1 Tax=Eumeta variegata TaxID=151549 RepID=A0A4C1WYV0_EUMVA|nr:hypothetical protein EVAR_58165_1 [Eumeta japonica]